MIYDFPWYTINIHKCDWLQIDTEPENESGKLWLNYSKKTQYVTFTFALKQGEIRASSGPIWLPLITIGTTHYMPTNRVSKYVNRYSNMKWKSYLSIDHDKLKTLTPSELIHNILFYSKAHKIAHQQRYNMMVATQTYDDIKEFTSDLPKGHCILTCKKDAYIIFFSRKGVLIFF